MEFPHISIYGKSIPEILIWPFWDQFKIMCYPIQNLVDCFTAPISKTDYVCILWLFQFRFKLFWLFWKLISSKVGQIYYS